jgi:hypothetical protein
VSNVIQLPARLVHAEADYRRPPLAWITRRARRIERFFQVSRRVAVAEAVENYFTFTRMHRERVLKLIGDHSHV